MANIRPFSPIRPNPFYAGELVFTKPQTESVAGKLNGSDNLSALKTLLETGARRRPETTKGQQQAYADIRDALHGLLVNERLLHGDSPGIYIYEVVQSGRRQTGVWALTELDDYAGGKIKVHEQTLADSVRRLKNYRQHTGLEGSPVLLAYHPDRVINQLVAEVKRGPANIALGNSHGLHQLWKVASYEQQECLIKAFKTIDRVYLADGHHRLESAHDLAIAQRQHGHPVYDCISSLYISTGELRIEPYDRVVIPDGNYDTAVLIRLIGQRFHLMESTSNRPVRPDGPFRMGMYLDHQWYHLLLKSESLEDPASLDAELLQKHLLEPLFGITDPRNDARLKYAGGEKALEEIGAVFQAHPKAVAFTLCPPSIEQLIAAAEKGRALPPKATWIMPKVPYGLLIQRHVNQVNHALNNN